MTQAEIDALNAQLIELDKAIASGELLVRHGQKLVSYQSADDQLARRTAIRRLLDAQAAPNRPLARSLNANFSDE
jgi:hypothetical protein